MPYYSESTGGFYDVGYRPPDAIEVTKEERNFLLGQQAAGKSIQVIDGKVLAVAPAEPSLDALKEQKKGAISAACSKMIDRGFAYDGHRYDSDLISRTNIIGTAAHIQGGSKLPEGFTWRTADNENVPMTEEGVRALGAALLAHVNAQYEISWALKAAVDAAASPEAIVSISWPA
ncbi:DUF4376 domain-containing protein [Achromobacter denitrificans]|uniref:DUF4376 domain-containing protein n=1 Tax=Achromobacter denitrificans TaxID=32002 RepID=UPI003D001BE4